MFLKCKVPECKSRLIVSSSLMPYVCSSIYYTWHLGTLSTINFDNIIDPVKQALNKICFSVIGLVSLYLKYTFECSLKSRQRFTL